ncbi:hypothetical protein FNV43_RR22536 [Rhamnella rubrinervis]|uniref:Leucine-rich repeat-containing N-terminal plant-type domain-containing protein n=1 Tax=Rhamnella rubrinervis TaxID=2594499 RepID=A0A8K0GN99_9ROSA|nr:hypothetical protein FNV43_RR22536 [Rhamnella rubrinervis]
MKMGTMSISFCASILLSTIFLHLCLQHKGVVVANGHGQDHDHDHDHDHDYPVVVKNNTRTNREVLEIIIGGGNNSPPPSPKIQKCPPPPRAPVSPRLLSALKVIQNFRQRITCDPTRYTDTWKGNDVCSYKGFTCGNHPQDNQRAVAGVNFNGAQLAVPVDITKLQFFYELDLSNNNLNGDFPLQVLGATKLTFLDLRFNKFCGSVPPLLFTLDVDVLFINNNNLETTLPNNLGSTPALYLTFANNKFYGPIPRSIGQASKTLREVLFLNNQLSGCLPYEIGYLGSATLFDASRNQLTGPIPHSFACLAKIQLLNLESNQLYGSIPELVCKLPNLERLSLANNYFTQIGPECKTLVDRKRLDVKMNCISDLPNQKSKAECAEFFKSPSTVPISPCLPTFLAPTNGFQVTKKHLFQLLRRYHMKLFHQMACEFSFDRCFTTIFH